MKRLLLRPGHDRRARGGHPWIFSNEIAALEGEIQNGDAVQVRAAGGDLLGSAYYNGHSLIAARILSRQGEDIDSTDFFLRHLSAALAYRRTLLGEVDAMRLVHGEADLLPGLVVDLYGDIVSVQFLALGMERRRPQILEALQQLLRPRCIVARNDVAVRELEGLPQGVEVLFGEPPERTIVSENGLRFYVDVLQGQKTGHFLDQRDNHRALQGRVEGRRVLDLFCYSGSWSQHAARYGARQVLGIDISASAVALAQENAILNGHQQLCTFQRADVFVLLRQLTQDGERFGTIILDPPAFVKSRGKLKEAIKGYLTINRRAMELLEPGGILFSCSCSHHLDRETFLDLLRQAGRQAGRTLRLLEMRGQAPDHPVLLNCPETEYLKCAVLHVS
jgi:23S rRNA (cytosine1962-C5)-methyltransferase